MKSRVEMYLLEYKNLLLGQYTTRSTILYFSPSCQSASLNLTSGFDGDGIQIELLHFIFKQVGQSCDTLVQT